MDILKELHEQRNRIDNAINVLTNDTRRSVACRNTVMSKFDERRLAKKQGKGRKSGTRLSKAARAKISRAAKLRWKAAKKAGRNKL